MTAQIFYLRQEGKKASVFDEWEDMGDAMMTIYVYLISLGGCLAVVALIAYAEMWLVDREAKKARKRPF
jgi:hypothetical protein